MNWLVKLLTSSVEEMLLGVISVFKFLIDNVFMVMYQLNQSINFTTARKYSVAIGIALVSVAVIAQGINVYVLHSEGDPDADALELITRIAKTTATIICGQWLIGYLVEIAGVFANELMSRVGLTNGSVQDSLKLYIDAIPQLSTTSSPLVFLIILVVIEIALIMFVFKAAKRGVELILFEIVLPIIALDILTTTKERWNAFKMELIVCIFGYILQVFSYNVFILIFSKAFNNIFRIDYLIYAISWLIISLNAPRWLKKFSYSSGVGNAAKGGARSVTGLMATAIRFK